MKRDHALQFKITLDEIQPAIWRRILVPSDYTFWDLHVAIQDAMGWLDSHLHVFRIPIPDSRNKLLIGIPDLEVDAAQRGLQAGWRVPVARHLTLETRKVEYEYDFGDGWQHTVTLEKVLQLDPSQTYPICKGGKRKCPPEDVGGIPGYLEFLKAISNPDHEQHTDMLTWVGGSYDPDDFDPKQVQFDDPKERWLNAFARDNQR